MTPLQAKAFNFYKKNSLSIEIVKDDVLQKVNFRVKNKVRSPGSFCVCVFFVVICEVLRERMKACTCE